MGAENDVVSMIFCSLFENVIDGKADQSHGFHFDPRGLQLLSENLQARIRR